MDQPRLEPPDMPISPTWVQDVAQLCCGIAWKTLIEHDPKTRLCHYAAGVSAALSSRFAAANASACRTSLWNMFQIAAQDLGQLRTDKDKENWLQCKT
jgi:hypothetical protein